MGDDSDPWATFTRDRMAERSVARELLAHALWNGRLMLLLGAGISIPIGLPSWTELVQRAAELVGNPSVDLKREAGGDLLAAMDAIRLSTGSDAMFYEAIEKALYMTLAANGEYPDQMLLNPLLNALGALTMTSARGSAAEVFNLNFDDVLEWYLHLHGFATQIVSLVPTLLDGHSDVCVYHPHGFVPLAPVHYRRRGAIVLTRSQYVDRLSEDAASPWNALILSRLHSKVFLAVGTSMNDIDIAVNLKKARSVIGEVRPLGFVIGNHAEHDCRRLAEQGLVPVAVSDRAEIPSFLLSVCRRASALQVKSRRG